MNNTPFSLEMTDDKNTKKFAFLRAERVFKVRECLVASPAMRNGSILNLHYALDCNLRRVIHFLNWLICVSSEPPLRQKS